MFIFNLFTNFLRRGFCNTLGLIKDIQNLSHGYILTGRIIFSPGYGIGQHTKKYFIKKLWPLHYIQNFVLYQMCSEIPKPLLYRTICVLMTDKIKKYLSVLFMSYKINKKKSV